MRSIPKYLWRRRLLVLILWPIACLCSGADRPAGSAILRAYENRLTPIKKPQPLLADHPEWVEPIRETNRFEAPMLVEDAGADLHLRAWRFSYNARGIVEIPNRLRADQTAIIVVHPWRIDDSQGWRTPEPAGVADFCTPQKNALSYEHTKGVIDPFLKRLRGQVKHVLYSEPGAEDPIRKKLYRSVRGSPTAPEREEGRKELALKLKSFAYRGEGLPVQLKLGTNTPVVDYFQQFPGLALAASYALSAADRAAQRALIAITMDLEMARNFPRWEDTHWDYEKGNLNEETKLYAVEAARRVKSYGGVIHFFVVRQVFEQENVDWLKDLVRAGHPVGNHTYDHVYILAEKAEDIQYRFKRAPWLIAGKKPAQVIRENVELCTTAMKTRLGIAPAGFRGPGGFADGLNNRPDVQKMLVDLGFSWVSCKYPEHPYSLPGTQPAREVFGGIVKAQAAAQPFVYPTGLIEAPMSPISDIGAFRNCRWKLDHFLQAVRLAVEWTIEHGAVFDLLCHPSVLYPSDPEFKAIELVCDLVKRAGDRAAIVDLGTIAQRVKNPKI